MVLPSAAAFGARGWLVAQVLVEGPRPFERRRRRGLRPDRRRHRRNHESNGCRQDGDAHGAIIDRSPKEFVGAAPAAASPPGPFRTPTASPRSCAAAGSPAGRPTRSRAPVRGRPRGRKRTGAPGLRARSQCTGTMPIPRPVLTIALMISTFSVSMTMCGSMFSLRKNRSITRRVPDPASNRTNGSPARSCAVMRLRFASGWVGIVTMSSSSRSTGSVIRSSMLDRQRQQAGVHVAGADFLDRSAGRARPSAGRRAADACGCSCLSSGGNTYRHTVMPPDSRSVPRSSRVRSVMAPDGVVHVLEHALAELDERFRPPASCGPGGRRAGTAARRALLRAAGSDG